MYSIGEISRATGVKVTTIRYYEEMGLIAHDGRTAGNQRRYSQAGLDRLTFIRHTRDLGLPIEAIRALISLEGKGGEACAESHRIAVDHLKDIRDRISRLKALESELVRISRSCDGSGDGPCSLFEAFADHGLCAGAH
ncbi:MAG TPA: MerR family transcriptional regulator [Aliiroseovarius sp.]|nr:MerR family transcriptional regulator [Aliiroseovarius sp.]